MDGQFSHCRFNLLGYHTNAMKLTDIGSTCINRTAENEDGWLTGFRTDADNFNLVQGEIRQIHAIPFYSFSNEGGADPDWLPGLLLPTTLL